MNCAQMGALKCPCARAPVSTHSQHAAHAVFPFQGLLLLPQHQPDDEPDKLSNLVFQFDPGKDRWTECASMKYSRYRCGAAVLNGEIYILGRT